MTSREIKNIKVIRFFNYVCGTISKKKKRNMLAVIDIDGTLYMNRIPTWSKRSLPFAYYHDIEDYLTLYKINDGIIMNTSLYPLKKEELCLTDNESLELKYNLIKHLRLIRFKDIQRLRRDIAYHVSLKKSVLIAEAKHKQKEKQRANLAKMKDSRQDKIVGSRSWNRLDENQKIKLLSKLRK